MRSVEIREFGLENRVVQEGERPEPGPGDVVVQVRAASINYRDFLIAQGFYNPNMPLPRIPLSDGAGHVLSVGEGVTGVEAGDRVTSLFWQNWADGPATPGQRSISTGCEAQGMLSEFAVLPETAVVAAPTSLSDEEAATLPCAALTAFSALTSICGARDGQSVMVLGTGGVALFALQFAKALGCRVMITSSSDAKLEKAKALGADEVINYKSTPEWGQEAFNRMGGVDVILETGGAGTLQQSIGAVGFNGNIAIIGTVSGMSAEIDVVGLMIKNAHVHGVMVGPRSDHEAMVRFIDEHGIKPIIDSRFALDQGAEALGAIAAGQHMGKLVVNVG